MNYLILFGCILLFISFLAWRFYKKKKRRVKRKVKTTKNHSYLYAIYMPGNDTNVFKIGKTKTSLRKRLASYETGNQQRPYYVMALKIIKYNLDKLEHAIQITFAFRKIFKDSKRKELFRFVDAEDLNIQIKKLLDENQIKYIDLLKTKEYNEFGYDLNRKNNL